MTNDNQGKALHPDDDPKNWIYCWIAALEKWPHSELSLFDLKRIGDSRTSTKFIRIDEYERLQAEVDRLRIKAATCADAAIESNNDYQILEVSYEKLQSDLDRHKKALDLCKQQRAECADDKYFGNGIPFVKEDAELDAILRGDN